MQTKIDVGIIGETSSFKLLRDTDWNLVRNMNQLLNYVTNLNLDSDVKEELFLYIQKYPDGSLNFLAKNFRSIAEKCMKKALAKRPAIAIDELPKEPIIAEKVKKALPIKPSLSNVIPGIELPITEKEQKPKWIMMNPNDVLNEIQKLQPIPEKKIENKTFDQISKEAEIELDKFIANEEYMKKLDQQQGEF